jgi:hypothetical protein
LSEGPEQLVDDVLAALREGLETGADALWAALTPRARGPLGDLAGTRRALTNELLSPLVAHTQARVADWERAEGVARTRVSVRRGPGATSEAAVERASGGAADGAREADADSAVTYLLSARREADGAWRITGLRRDDLLWS